MLPITDMGTIKEILLSHGGGGMATRRLIEEVFLKRFTNPSLAPLDDSAELPLKERLAFTTDSYVVQPLFFPGGDIGRLAVSGTVNDLWMKGAKPLFLSTSFIIEEGLKLDLLERVVRSMASTAKEAGAEIACGDTKVVEKGGADGLFITTSGVGRICPGVEVSGGGAKPGDTVICSGTLGDHGMAIISQREGIDIRSSLKSDCAPLTPLLEVLLAETTQIHSMRDPTRGGLATALNEIAQSSKVGIFLREEEIPVKEEVRGICELLGLDPLYVANEGKLILILPSGLAQRALQVLRSHPLGKDARLIGWVEEEPKGVFLKTRIGGTRPLLMLEGEQLPRIC